MKRMRIIGILALVLTVVVLAAGVFSLMLRGQSGSLAHLRAAAGEWQAAKSAAQSNLKSAESAARKAGTAVQSANAALAEAQEAYDALEATVHSLQAQTEDGIAIHDLYAWAMNARDTAGEMALSINALDRMVLKMLGEGGSLQETLAYIVEAAGKAETDAEQVVTAAEVLVLEALREEIDGAQSAVKTAEDANEDARKAINAVMMAISDVAPLAEDAAFSSSEVPPETVLDVVMSEAAALREKGQWLTGQAQEAQTAASLALSLAQNAQQSIQVGTRDTIINWLATYYIAIWFTCALLLAIGVVFTFFPGAFLRQWKTNPVFSTFIALVVLLIVQTYSMRFTYNSFGEWGKFWFDNAFNVLRANTSVGIIALGMTLVIITGGIDLAVGSTLAGVGTVLMVLIDTSQRGLLGMIGITGVPAYIVGIAGALLTGVLIGALIGLGVTKGRVPPFIITLGAMNIIRSISQYVTKAYTPKVPSDFTAISNTVVFGQRLLPILFWLVLAVLLYIIMRRTRFGRYVYAVGSNERTTRLSGINTDRVKCKVYTLMGLLVAIASVTQVSRLGGMDVASAGSGYELDAIAAVVVGGTSMSGGRGSIVGTVIGVLIIGVMNNLLILLGVDSFLTNAFKGAIVVAAVLMQRKEKVA